MHFVVVTNEPGLKLGSKAKALVLIERCACRRDDESAACQHKVVKCLTDKQQDCKSRQMHIIDPLVKRKILLEVCAAALMPAALRIRFCSQLRRQSRILDATPSSFIAEAGDVLLVAVCLQQNICDWCVGHRQAATLVVFEFAWLSVRRMIIVLGFVTSALLSKRMVPREH